MTTLSKQDKPNMMLCEQCKSWVRKDRMAKHLAQVHGTSQTVNHPKPWHVLCPECGAEIASANLKHHIAIVHAAPEIKRPARRVIMPKSHHLDPCEPEPMGITVMKGLRNGILYVASYTILCQSCRQRIVLLPVGKGCYKAFDVDKQKNIVGSHGCDDNERGESVYAWRGGLVDCNRRKH